MRFLRSQILCKLYKSHSDETINRGPPSVYTRAQNITYARKRFCSPCWSSKDYGNIKITQHALKVSEPSEY